MFLPKLSKLYWQVKFALNGFTFYPVGGGKGDDSAPQAAKPPSPEEIARQQVDAAISQRPRAAQAEFDILTGPAGLEATTAEFERVRQELFPQETQVREQLLSNTLANLISPTGISPEQQAAVGQRRGEAQNELQQALRTRANLGGGLFGGRAGRTEERAVSDLQARFAEEDIGREERNRLNAIQAALPALQLLFPDIGLQTPQFINPVASPEAGLAATQQTNLANAQLQSQKQGQDAALQAALFQAVGSAVGGAAGGAASGGFSEGGAFGCWVAKEIFGSWEHPKTIAARHFIQNSAPKWFKNFYMKYGERIAKFISNKPIIKLILRPLFETFALIGGTKCQVY